MDLTESAMWTVVEEAVMQDRGEDEEAVLAQMVRAYLARRGLADTLHAFDEERRDYNHPSEHKTQESQAEHGSGATTQLDSANVPEACGSHATHEVDRRKAAQLLCLQEKFEAAAALMPPASLARIRLLCIQAQHLSDTGEAVFFLASHVSPLVPFCANPVLGHDVYTATLSNVLNPHRQAPQLDIEALAKEVNDELCGNTQLSSLDILFNWAYWQETSA